jgi:hypothetical protein
MGDPFSGPVWTRYREHVLAEMVPKLTDSAVALSIVPPGDGDVKYWVELGASIMLDKPIIVVAAPDRVIPVRLRRVADAVVIADLETDAGRQELAERLALLIGEVT